ncbi:inositol monophosphatase family protein [Pontibacter sp. G13]|uniref:inositol monophosphatase family protein n=1 Tax=Pontibacter sp. G13 TaxID=3074898 RepID=UPI00288A733E|nr:inositol monophosphatase family protein [Pontibacter sp. G13]WNJ17480.1 inositol monophosphatase family protein [Pontibacter sp. G13]
MNAIEPDGLMRDKLTFIQSLALQAGRIMRSHWGRSVQIYRKQDRTVVTEVDLEISRMVQEQVQTHFPNHDLISEETWECRGPKGAQGFIVDELDGTNSFVKGRKGFVFQCAVYELRDVLVMGLVYDPLEDLMVFAKRGAGCWIKRGNQVMPLESRSGKPWEMLNYAHHRNHAFPTYHQLYQRLNVEADRIISTGNVGAKAIEFARGSVDVLIGLNRNIPVWDWAPGKVILEELGYSLSYLNGHPLQIHVPNPNPFFGYLVCPKDHRKRFVQELGWISNRMNRPKRNIIRSTRMK